MQLISLRKIPFIDTDSLVAGEAKEALFRDASGGFILYLADELASAARLERIVRLGLREALIWLNEPAPEQQSWWG